MSQVVKDNGKFSGRDFLRKAVMLAGAGVTAFRFAAFAMTICVVMASAPSYADVIADALRTNVLGPEAELSSYRAVLGSPEGRSFKRREDFIRELTPEVRGRLAAELATGFARAAALKQGEVDAAKMAEVAGVKAPGNDGVRHRRLSSLELGGVNVVREAFEWPDGLQVPVMTFEPGTVRSKPVIVLGEGPRVRREDYLREALAAGAPASAVDLLGYGEIAGAPADLPPDVDPEEELALLAYARGGQTLVGRQASELLEVASALKRRYGKAPQVVACGRTNYAAAHARQLRPDLISGITVHYCPAPWRSTIKKQQRFARCVPAALGVYDWADLAAKARHAPPPDGFQGGVNFGFCAPNGFYGSDKAREEVDRMAQANVSWVCVIVTVWQKTWHETEQYRDWLLTPNDLEIKDIIDYIHSKGMKVMLRPMEEALDGTDRGSIQFKGESFRMPGRRNYESKKWFEGMRARSRYYATIAQRTGCEVYCLDSEIDGLMAYNEEWRQVVSAVRDVYGGAVTSCHFVRSYENLAKRADAWVRDLDFITISDYYSLPHGDGATLDDLVNGFKPRRAQLRNIAKAFNMPVVLGEIGCTSCRNAAGSPSSWKMGGGYDGEEQARYLEAAYTCYSAEPWFRGMYWWKWDEQVDRPNFRDDPAGDKGFTVRGKPAEAVMRRLYKRK